MPEAVQIFIEPPSVDALRARLVGRGTDDPEQMRAPPRAAARDELEARGEFHHVVVNDRLEEGVRAARADRAWRARLAARIHRRDLPPHRQARSTRRRNYASVIVAAKRARQINSYYHNLGEGTFDEFPPPMVETRSKNYLTIALEEVAQGKIKYHYR